MHCHGVTSAHRAKCNPYRVPPSPFMGHCCRVLSDHLTRLP
jgi:hypothetical protein